MAAQTHLFPCLSDNYGVLLHDPETGATASIDAPEAAAVEKALAQTGWKLTDILVTHHHADHTDGIMALKDKYKCRVVAPAAEAAKIPGVDETVSEGDKVKVGNLIGNVIETPGHTLGHIAYWFHADNHRLRRRQLVFDRLRPGDRRHHGPDVGLAAEAARPARQPRKFFAAMNTPPANIKFAPQVDKDNPALEARAEQAQKQIAAGAADHPHHHRRRKENQSVPARRSRRLACDIGMAGKPANEVFAEIRTAQE